MKRVNGNVETKYKIEKKKTSTYAHAHNISMEYSAVATLWFFIKRRHLPPSITVQVNAAGVFNAMQYRCTSNRDECIVIHGVCACVCAMCNKKNRVKTKDPV